MLVIDGSMGEGGGQVLRTSLSLSVLTGRPFKIEQIRAGRSKPGLRPQHLTAVQVAAELCQAKLTGDQPGSTNLTFQPKAKVTGGGYHFDVTDASASGRSAGAVSLILETALWPLLYAAEHTQINIKGGTFVPYSPPYHFIEEVVRPVVTEMGGHFSTRLKRWGWMQGGGGEIEALVRPSKRLHALQLNRVVPEVVRGVAAVTNLPSHIPQRMAGRAINIISDHGFKAQIRPIRDKGDGPGAGIVLWIPQAGFSSLGHPGLPAEKVADAAVAEMAVFLENGAAVDPYLADQILVPMALAKGSSSFTTSRITAHTLTNAELVRQWLQADIKIEGEFGEFGRIFVEGIDFL